MTFRPSMMTYPGMPVVADESFQFPDSEFIHTHGTVLKSVSYLVGPAEASACVNVLVCKRAKKKGKEKGHVVEFQVIAKTPVWKAGGGGNTKKTSFKTALLWHPKPLGGATRSRDSSEFFKHVRILGFVSWSDRLVSCDCDCPGSTPSV